jgi:hypothetical protein
MSRRASLDAPKILHHTMARKIERAIEIRDERGRGELVARLAGLADAGALPVYAWLTPLNHAQHIVRTRQCPPGRCSWIGNI